MGIFDVFKRNKEVVDCESMKQSPELYPSPSISLVMVTTDSGKLGTGWVDLSYVNYPFKPCCSYNLQFTIEVPDDDEEQEEELDFDTLENYFIQELKKGCIAHAVARVATDNGFIMDVYVDDVDFASKVLTEMYENPNKLVEFGCGVHHDPKWKEYNRITKLTK